MPTIHDLVAYGFHPDVTQRPIEITERCRAGFLPDLLPAFATPLPAIPGDRRVGVFDPVFIRNPVVQRMFGHGRDIDIAPTRYQVVLDAPSDGQEIMTLPYRLGIRLNCLLLEFGDGSVGVEPERMLDLWLRRLWRLVGSNHPLAGRGPRMNLDNATSPASSSPRVARLTGLRVCHLLSSLKVAHQMSSVVLRRNWCSLILSLEARAGMRLG